MLAESVFDQTSRDPLGTIQVDFFIAPHFFGDDFSLDEVSQETDEDVWESPEETDVGARPVPRRSAGPDAGTDQEKGTELLMPVSQAYEDHV